MDELEYIPTEYQVKKFRAEDLIDQDFLGFLREQDPNIVVDHILLSSIKTEEDEKVITTDRMALGHINREEERESVLNIGSRKPVNVELIRKALYAFNEKRKKSC